MYSSGVAFIGLGIGFAQMMWSTRGYTWETPATVSEIIIYPCYKAKGSSMTFDLPMLKVFRGQRT